MQDTHVIEELDQLLEESLQEQNRKRATKRNPNQTLSPYLTPLREESPIEDPWIDKMQIALIEERSCASCGSVEKVFIGWYLCRYNDKTRMTEVKSIEHRDGLISKTFITNREVGGCMNCEAHRIPSERASISECGALSAFRSVEVS